MVMGRCGETFPDNRTDYETAEVALDVNAGLTGKVDCVHSAMGMMPLVPDALRYR
jgi:hypothetical protein